jgi:signal transduction histidine kinase/ActR/RegA family two-component response regulator
LPIIVLTMGGKTTRYSAKLAAKLAATVNHAFLERPLRILTLVSAVRTAWRARARQYEIRAMLDHAAEEIRKRDQFIAMLGHELRNPLAAIRTSVEITKQFGSQEPDLVLDQCAIIDRQSRHILRLVDDLVDLARLTSGRVKVSKSPTNLKETIQKSVENIRLALSDSHPIQVSLPPEDVVVMGDAVRLEQIIGNLLSNAIRYSPSNRPINVTLEKRNDIAITRVKDQGEGIDPRLLSQIFEPFVQAPQGLARTRGGMGLGLAIVRDLVALHGGTVEARSDGIGSGSEFVVLVPTIQATSESMQQTPSSNSENPPKKILVIEDNPDARQTLVLLLRLLKHQVYEAADGESGLERLLALKPEVAMIDVGLPKLSGYEVVSRARSVLGRRTVMIAVTGYGQPSDRERAIEAGFDAHLVKPIAASQIGEIIAQVQPGGQLGPDEKRGND